MSEDFIARAHEIDRHGAAHVSEPDEADAHMGCSKITAGSKARLSPVAAECRGADH